MTPKTAELILRNLNTPSIQDAFSVYVNERIETHKNLLETATTLDQLQKSQGALSELRLLLKMRESAIAIVGK